mgnify:CR=1 FL=1
MLRAPMNFRNIESVRRGLALIRVGTWFSTADLIGEMASNGMRTPSRHEMGALMRRLCQEGTVEVVAKERNGFAYIHGWNWTGDE